MLKKIVERSLVRFGFQLSRTPRHLRVKKVIPLTVTVGKYEIDMPSNSLMPDLFAVNPDYSSELGRLVAATRIKYPRLCVIDVGANYGDSVAIVKSVAEVPIICIEGDEQCLGMLRQNVGQFANVEIHNLFLGETSETISARFEKKGWNATIVPSNNGSSRELGLTSLDDFMSTVGYFPDCKVLKVDTEGFDCRIIRGGLRFIADVKPVIALEYNRDNMSRIGETGIETLGLLKDIGYDTILFYDGTGRLVLSSSLTDMDSINDLHEYANGRDGAIYYYDLCLFHREDTDIASNFRRAERERLRLANAAV
jgi:FkbM family methyltransferase